MDEQTTPKGNYPLRLPADLRQALQRMADREHRSLHAEMIHALTLHVLTAAAKGANK